MARISAGVPSTMTRPSCIIVTHSATRNATSMSCSIRISVIDGSSLSSVSVSLTRSARERPAAGLSRAERVKLTELLLALDPQITLILIEHDMDVALRVAEWVTMMHDGRVIVEGTPDEIRANELVHDLYLGSAHR